MKKRKMIFVVFIFIILVFSTNIIYEKYVQNYNKTQQYTNDDKEIPRESSLEPIIKGDNIYQVLNFKDLNNPISGLGICFGTYGKENNSNVFIKIKDDMHSEEILNKVIDAKELKDNEYYNIIFDKPCKTNKLTIEITSDAEKKDEAITLWITNSNYKTANGLVLNSNENQLYRNGNKLSGNISTNAIYLSSPISNQRFTVIWIGFSLLLSIILYSILIIMEDYLHLIKNIRNYMANFMQYLPLLKELVIKEIKLKYKRSTLGFAWSVLNPLLMMGVMTIVFSTLFKSNINNFPVYLILGQVIFNFFAEATNAAMGSVIANASLINKVYIPKYIFPMSKILSSLVNLIFSIIAVGIVVIITRVNITVAIIASPLGLLYVAIFALGIGLILASYTVFFRDIIHLYGVLILIWTYVTPIFYPIEIIPKQFLLIAKLNPMYCYIRYFREIILDGKVPNMELNILCIVYSSVALIIGIIVFYKNQDKFVLHL